MSDAISLSALPLDQRYLDWVCDLTASDNAWIKDLARIELKRLTKSEQTPELASVHHPLGTHGLWGSKDEQLPAYIQNIAAALMRSGHDRSEAIQLAVGAVQRWAHGGGKVSAEVQAAAAAALAEWEKLRAEHATKK